MNDLVMASIFLAGLLIVVFTILIRRVLAPTAMNDVDLGEWLDKFSVGRYRPMERLLSDGDFEFLSAQPGYDPSIARQLKSERRRIFRIYLRHLSQDFSRLHHTARLMLIYSPEDRPELARTLLLQRWIFQGAMLRVQWHLVLHAAGLSSVDVTGLLRAVDSLNLQIRQPAFEPAAG